MEYVVKSYYGKGFPMSITLMHDGKPVWSGAADSLDQLFNMQDRLRWVKEEKERELKILQEKERK